LKFQKILDIDVSLKSAEISLNIQFPNDEKKIFFINGKFSFSTVKDMLEQECPGKQIILWFFNNPTFFKGLEVDFDFKKSNSNLTIESNVIKFLKNEVSGEVDHNFS